ncbi:hypothetical protein DERF_014976 [Dermatophagoides farinae]|uniref:Uncharacterized protein n=1 Tax=Dermatophagoides farinae TaxID=6954 RepID=A0A922HNB3_DERFA|nr:hypothetical protein DERF_014976 [Dermatophagoides farinae]
MDYYINHGKMWYVKKKLNGQKHGQQHNNHHHNDGVDDNNDDFILPINVGHECQILLNNNDELRRCQHDAYLTWIRSWQLELLKKQNNYHHQQQQQQHQHQSKFEGPEQLNGKNPCCYRWALLDCLTDSVQKYCPMANTFDSRLKIMH